MNARGAAGRGDSRHVVGWTVEYRESARTAEALIAESTYAQGTAPGTLTIHAIGLRIPIETGH